MLLGQRELLFGPSKIVRGPFKETSGLNLFFVKWKDLPCDILFQGAYKEKRIRADP